MTRLQRRLLFYPMLLAVIAACGKWCVSVPYHPERLPNTIPSEARWVSLHRSLSDRWISVAAHPAVQRAVAGAGYDPQAWVSFVVSKSVRHWVSKLGADDLYVAGWPGRPGGPWTWMASSWIGAESQRFRWMLQAGRVPGVCASGDYAGRRIWRLDAAPSAPETRRLYFALEEGIVLATFSEQPRDLCRALDAYDGTYPRSAGAARLSSEHTADAAVWNLGIGPGPDVAHIQISEWSGERMVVRTQWTGWEGLQPVDPETAGCGPQARAPAGTTAHFWGCAPEALVWADWQSVKRLLSPRDSLSREMLILGDADFHGPVTFALFGSPLWGRFFGLRTPGLVVAAKLKDDSDFMGDLANAMDRLNAQSQWGLIAGADPAAPAIRIFEAPGAGRYSMLPPGERSAFVVSNGWMCAALGADTLRGLFGPAASTNGMAALRDTKPAEAMPWHGAAQVDAPWRAWVDIERGAGTLRMAAAVLDLKVMASGATPESVQRQSIKGMRTMLNIIEPFSSLELSATPGDEELRGEWCLRMRPAGASEKPAEAGDRL